MSPYIVIICTVLYVHTSNTLECISRKDATLKFSITSQRNETGHWSAKVQLKHDAAQDAEGPWDIDVDHTVTSCDKTDSITIDVTLFGPPVIKNKEVNRQCPSASGYLLMPNLGYYKLYNEPETWHQALEVCEKDGANLLIINSEQEATAMGTIMVSSGIQHWVGIHDMYGEGTFITIFNDSLQATGYSKWRAAVEPNGGTNENCLTYLFNNGLNDISCTRTLPFICESKLCKNT